ncbi:antirestriction protein ArdA [Scytonema tolypothrichoides VB-61278]|nr:antirestriction protein ArdA [Scytonema tolypothrichoides VB-61278]
MPKALMFNTESDARRVASYLYDCEVKGNIITFTSHDQRAVDLAISLTGVDLPLIEGAKCLLSFPKRERECRDDTVPQLYCSCLSSYNAGFLHGLWIDATQEPDDIQDDIDWMLSWSPVAEDEICEEYAIHDYSGFCGIRLSEHEDLQKVSAIAQAIDEHGAVMAAFLDWKSDHYSNPDIAAIVEQFDEYFCGHWDDEEDFVVKSDEIEEVFNWKQFEKQFTFWSHHIDWSGVARDLFLQDYHAVRVRDYQPNSYGIWVFRCDDR